MTIPTMYSVQSSMLQSIGFNTNEQAIYVRFNNGKTYRYLEATQSDFEALRDAESVGKHLNAIVKPLHLAELVE